MRIGRLDKWTAPFLPNYFSVRGWLDDHPDHRKRTPGARVKGASRANTDGDSGFCSVFGYSHEQGREQERELGRGPEVSWLDLAVLLGPFTALYLVLLVPRTQVLILDRYFVPLQVFALIGLARYYQQRIRSTFPTVGVALTAVWALYAIVSTHDLFVMYRGFEGAYNRVLSSGLPPAELSGTWEMDGLAQVQAMGYINRMGIQNVPRAYRPYPHIEFPASCYYESDRSGSNTCDPCAVWALIRAFSVWRSSWLSTGHLSHLASTSRNIDLCRQDSSIAEAKRVAIPVAADVVLDTLTGESLFVDGPEPLA